MKAQKLLRSSLVVAALLPVGLFGACTGNVGPGNPEMSSSGSGNGGSNGSSGAAATGSSGSGSTSGGATSSGSSAGTTTSTTMPPIPTALMAESAGVLPMRALTYEEYANILSDLLNNTTDPTLGWPAASENTMYFVAPTSYAEAIVDNMNTAANTVVDAALAAGSLSIPCTNPATSAETTCVQSFITTFGLRAYRRPVAAAEMTDLTTLFTTVRGLGLSFTQSVAAVVKGMIQSPNFLYHWEIGPTAPTLASNGLVPLTQWQIASRLASTLWQSMPDNTLLQAAQAGNLATADQVAAQAQRLLADTTGHAAHALYDFHFQLLFSVGTHDLGDLTALGKTSPIFTAGGQSSITSEFTQFLSSVYSTGDGTLNTLLTATYSYINQDLAPIYGVTSGAPATGFAKVELPAGQRAGILTQTAYMAANANDAVDNPVFRGLGVYVKLFCGTIGSPPANVPAVNFIQNGTTRQSYQMHAASTCAAGCHNLFDPPGFAFEHYDGDGLYRTTDTGLPVDSTGAFTTPGGATLNFTSAMDLMPQFAQSAEVQQCMAREWTRYSLGRAETSAEVGSLQRAYQKGAATPGFSLTTMLASLFSSEAFMYRAQSPGETL
jgi:hypothetical protein